MNSSEIGIPDQAHPPSGKYDIQPAKKASLWKELTDLLLMSSNILAARAIANDPARAALAANLDSALEQDLYDLDNITKRLNAYAPLFADNLASLEELIPTFNNLRQTIRMAPPTNPANKYLRQAEVLIADLRRQQMTFDIQEELDECHESLYYKTHTKGIAKYLSTDTDTLKAHMRSRDAWAPLVETAYTAVEDELLGECASRVLRQQGFETFRHLLVLILLFQRHLRQRMERDFSDDEICRAVVATIKELHTQDTATMLGIWFIWYDMRPNRNSTLNAFVNKLTTNPLTSHLDLPLGQDSQFRKRAFDPYLITRQPEEWEFDAWDKKGKKTQKKTPLYMENIRTAAIAFKNHLFNTP